jgi:UDP-perosamine 4-acetyltransferase
MSTEPSSPSRPIAVIGGGGHGRVVIEALRRAGALVAGVVDPKAEIGARLPNGIRYLGATLSALDPRGFDVAMGVGSIDVGAANPRPRVFAEAKAAGFTIRAVVHPSAVLAEDAVLGEGSHVMAGAVLQPGVVLGANCIVNTGATIDHDCRIGDHVHLAPGVVLSGGVSVGEGCHLGTGVVIIQGITIGVGSMISAGLVVTRDVPAGTRLSRKTLGSRP